MTSINSKSTSVNDNTEIAPVKQSKQVQKALDKLAIDSVKPIKDEDFRKGKADLKKSSSESVGNAIDRSIERIQGSGKGISAIKVDELWKVKDGLKKIEVGSGVDKSKAIPKSPLEKGVENISNTFKGVSSIKDFLIGSGKKAEALYSYVSKELSTENLDFLKAVDKFTKNPSMSSLKELYDNKIKNLNINPEILSELPKAIEKGNVSKAMELLNIAVKDVIQNISGDTLTNFKLTPEFKQFGINEAKSEIAKNLAVNSDNKFKLEGFIANPVKFKSFDNFAVRDKSYEDVKFLGSVNNLIKKDNIVPADLVSIYRNYIDPPGSASINLDSEHLKIANSFKTCIENGDVEGALKDLNALVSKSANNAEDSFSRFTTTSEYKEIVKKEINTNIEAVLKQPTTKEIFTQDKVEGTKEFIEFAKNEFSTENLDFLKDIKALLPNPSMDDLKNLQQKYSLDQKTPNVNISGVNLKQFNDAISSNNYLKAFDSLIPITKDARVNINDTFSRFITTNDFKDMVNKDILKPIEKLPLRKQLAALNEAIKDNPNCANIIKVKKTELLDKFMPKIPLGDNAGEIKGFIDGFKKATANLKTTIFGGEIDNVNKALVNFQKVSVNNPEDIRGQIESLDKVIKQVDTFMQKRGSESSKAEWVEALGSRLQEAKTSLLENFSQTEEGKLYNIGSGVQNILDSSKGEKYTSFDQMSKLFKLEAKDAITKNPHGELAWSFSTLPEDIIEKEISDKVDKSFPKLNESQKQILKNKILEGYKEGLPTRLTNSNNTDEITHEGEQYKFTKTLGKGNFGAVFKYENENGKSLAVKSIQEKNYFDKEIEAHKIASGKPENYNENVTAFKGAIISGNIYLSLQEFADGGDLKDIIKKLNIAEKSGKISHSDMINVKRYIAENIIKGMVHINETRDMMHLDIKPDNIMYDKKTGKFKIADFGTADKNQIETGNIGTDGYKAPEIYINGEFDKDADKWSMGIALQELMTDSKVTHFANSDNQLRTAEGKSEPTALGNMINNLVQVDPTKRTKFSDVLKSPYFTDPIGTDERAIEILNQILSE